MLSHASIGALSTLHTLLYVLPFYLSPTTRPSPQLLRDAPEVIRARCRLVYASVAVSTAIHSAILGFDTGQGFSFALYQLRIWPCVSSALPKALLLTSLLFAGPLFERLYVDGEWQGLQTTAKSIEECLESWTGWRNFVVGPASEEIVFRGILASLYSRARPAMSQRMMICMPPLYFGLAHIHHCYEFKLSHPTLPLLPVLLRSLFQFAYTTVFGWYATYIYLCTNSLLAVIFIHAGCNWIGLPRLWGKIRMDPDATSIVTTPQDLMTPDGVKEPARPLMRSESKNNLPTLIYYILLLLGFMTWWISLNRLV